MKRETIHEERDPLSSITVVLNETRYPENIGAAARACKNFGITRIRLVRPELLRMENVLKMATHEARDLIENMVVYDRLANALQDQTFVIGTSARTGRQRRPSHTPKEMAALLPTLLANNRIALLFGSEKFGLNNEHLAFCNALVTIPTTNFSSLNLAQSVVVILYEIFEALAGGVISRAERPRLATVKERQGMFQHLEKLFGLMGLMEKQPLDYWMRNAHRLLDRKDLTARDVKTIRGFCRNAERAIRLGPAEHCNREE